MAIKDVLDWADAVCGQALTEARAGDTNLLNRVGSNSAMKLYMDNVHGLKSVTREQFPAYYSMQYKEIDRLYTEYQRDQTVAQSVDKVSALEAKLDKLEGLITQLIETQKPAAPAKKGKAKVAQVANAVATSTSVVEVDDGPEDDEEKPEGETDDEPKAEEDAPAEEA